MIPRRLETGYRRDRQPSPAPVSCVHCGEPDRPGDPMLPIGPRVAVGWFHKSCYLVYLREHYGARTIPSGEAS